MGAALMSDVRMDKWLWAQRRSVAPGSASDLCSVGDHGGPHE
jgi:ribosomal 50S subunit-recycling heat shock protein